MLPGRLMSTLETGCRDRCFRAEEFLDPNPNKHRHEHHEDYARSRFSLHRTRTRFDHRQGRQAPRQRVMDDCADEQTSEVRLDDFICPTAE